MTVRELLATAAAELAGRGVADSETDARLLYCHLAGVDRTGMILQYREDVNEEFLAAYRRLLERRAAGEPLQYITGEQVFMGLPFRVAPGVLIPRPETELLVEKAAEWAGAWSGGPAGAQSGAAPAGDRQAAGPQPIRILDIGCGSGAIGVSLAALVPGAAVTCTDISDRALAIARQNAADLKVEVEFLQGDLLEPVEGRRFDMIVSNPPYIPEEVVRGLATEVKDHEPEKALCGGKDGLDIYRRMIPALPGHLTEGGVVLMEIGYDQMEAVKRLLVETGAFTAIEGFQDLAGLDRIVTGRLAGIAE